MEHRNGVQKSTRQIRLVKHSPMYWRVTFDHPPLNIFGPETIPQLNEIVAGQVGAALVPGGGPMARLPRPISGGRALEVLLAADDVPGDLAEPYGYVNRSLPDAELDGFVDALATRIASFDKDAIRETKRLVDVASLPPDIEIAPERDAFLASTKRPAAQERIRKLTQQGFHKPGDAETHLGHYVGQLGR